ncbi:hypothetical protein FIBSPDRAFT_958154 [Athelia psychrophila]|uniref:DUF6534 domain-containing protein n=1 Tax=Athelia psychrophila TaxID=1759441 RepID=A0A166EZI6_9AGAM|nr:hypothetical protein FIBSPDRAFT_958154 [Fibularhizoctonia sp. CBS 109695]
MSNPIATPWGFILIGFFLSLILFGIIISQVFTYFRNCDKDPLWQKLFVLIVFTLDILSSILAMAWLYWLLIDNWGQIEAFKYGDWLLVADPMVAGILVCMVQCFFAWRIQIIAGKKWLTMVIVFCAFVTMCGGIGSGIMVIFVPSYAALANFKQFASICLISAAVGDIIITTSLTYHLRRYKGNCDATDEVLDRIINLTVQNGLLTSLVAIVDICLYMSTSIPYHMALSFLMPKLYSNTVLSSLNARKYIRRDMTTILDCGGRLVIRGPEVIDLTTDRSPTLTTRPEIFVEVYKISDAKVDTE